MEKAGGSSYIHINIHSVPNINDDLVYHNNKVNNFNVFNMFIRGLSHGNLQRSP